MQPLKPKLSDWKGLNFSGTIWINFQVFWRNVFGDFEADWARLTEIPTARNRRWNHNRLSKWDIENKRNVWQRFILIPNDWMMAFLMFHESFRPLHTQAFRVEISWDLRARNFSVSCHAIWIQ
jgi:hypothetical protein